MAKITEQETRGMNTAYAGNNAFNAVDAQIHKQIQEKETTFLANITKLYTEEEKGATYVDANPIIQMVDANGDTYKSPDYVKIPHYRVQAGIAALIIDPTEGDIGVFTCAKRDISNVTQENHQAQQPASFRGFSASDAIMIGQIHTKEPTTFIHLRQAENCHWVIPEGVLGETNKTVQWEVGEDVIQHIGRDRTETIGQNRDVTIDNNDTLTVKNNQTITVQNNQDLTVQNNQTISVTSNQDETVGGNVTVTISGNKQVTISGNCDVTINGTCNVTVTGEANLTSSAQVNVTAPVINLTAPVTNVSGILRVGGVISAGVGGGAGGTSTFNGGINATQTINSQQDVTATGISLNSHTHTCPDGGTSGPH